MNKCNCNELEDDLIEQGYTCYNCYTDNKDVSRKGKVMEEIILECLSNHEWIGVKPYCSACGVDKGDETND